MTEVKPKILIVAPHSKCVDAVERDCDRRADEVATGMERIAREAGYDVRVFKAEVPRSVVDNNRAEAFDTPWRQAIRDYIEANSGSPIIVFEMHSYPNEGTEFTEGSQMALLAIDEYHAGTRTMHEYLTAAGIRVSSAINRTRVNNLMVDTSRYSNIKNHYLLEFNEDKTVLRPPETNFALMQIFVASLLPKCVWFCRRYLGVFVALFVLFLLYHAVYRTDSSEPATRRWSTRLR